LQLATALGFPNSTYAHAAIADMLAVVTLALPEKGPPLFG
jgi:hypothetical protein